MKTLFIIPARKGSKGLVDKNILELNSSPLINYSIDFALKIAKLKKVTATMQTKKVKTVEFVIETSKIAKFNEIILFIANCSNGEKNIKKS